MPETRHEKAGAFPGFFVVGWRAVERLAPKHRIVASANYTLGNFSLNARANYYSSWQNAVDYGRIVGGVLQDVQTFGAKTTADLDLSYTIADHYTLTIGAANIFNTYPDKISPSPVTPIYALTSSTADGQIYPRSGGPFGINGGFYYARLRVKY